MVVIAIIVFPIIGKVTNTPVSLRVSNIPDHIGLNGNVYLALCKHETTYKLFNSLIMQHSQSPWYCCITYCSVVSRNIKWRNGEMQGNACLLQLTLQYVNELLHNL